MPCDAEARHTMPRDAQPPPRARRPLFVLVICRNLARTLARRRAAGRGPLANNDLEVSDQGEELAILVAGWLKATQRAERDLWMGGGRVIRLPANSCHLNAFSQSPGV